MTKKISIIFTAVLLILLSGCSIFDSKNEQPEKNPILRKLPNMEYHYFINDAESEYSTIVNNVVNGDILENIIKNDGEKGGDIIVECNKLEVKKGKFFTILSVCTVSALNWFGMPYRTGFVDMKLVFNIISKDGTVRKSYAYNEKQKVCVGIYYGHNVKTTVINTTKKIMNDFKYDLNKECITHWNEYNCVEQNEQSNVVIENDSIKTENDSIKINIQ